MKPLEILYQDDNYVVINKPSGLLIHKTSISTDKVFALQILRNQIKKRVYPVHRIDRATSGIVIFALNKEALKLLSYEFEHKNIKKVYYSLVRGFIERDSIVNYALKNPDNGNLQESITNYEVIDKFELPISVGRYKTSRYTLLKLNPLTGRKHQIRKHMHHIFHPIIGDTSYGDGKHNKMFREEFNINRLLLFAKEISFFHPFYKKEINVNCNFDQEFLTLIEKIESRKI